MGRLVSVIMVWQKMMWQSLVRVDPVTDAFVFSNLLLITGLSD